MKTRQGRVVLFQGTFEIVNYGHVLAFRRAKSDGDYLIIALNTNALVRSYKKREPVLPWKHKAFIIRSIRWVDEVIQAHSFSPMKLLEEIRPAVYVIGDEWIESKAKEIAFVESYGGRIVITPRYKGVVPTSEIKKRLVEEAASHTVSVSGDTFTPVGNHKV